MQHEFGVSDPGCGCRAVMRRAWLILLSGSRRWMPWRSWFGPRLTGVPRVTDAGQRYVE